MTDKLEFEKSAWRVWLLALAGVPFLLIGADLFFEQKLVGAFGDLIYGTEDLPAFEPRDTIVAALFLIGGLTLTLWGLKELVFPKKVFVADHDGIRLALSGPFRPALLVPWDSLTDLEYKEVDDEGDSRPAIRMEVAHRGDLPDNPWGARWVASGVLVIDAANWSPPPVDIVESVWQYRQSLRSSNADED